MVSATPRQTNVDRAPANCNVLVFNHEPDVMRIPAIGRFSAIVGLVGAISAFGPSGHLSSATTICMPSDTFAVWMVANFQAVMTSTDTIKTQARVFMQLPVVAASQISYVTNDKTCNSAATAYNAALVGISTIPPSGTVYVWQVRTDYVVMDTVQRVGEWRRAMTLDRHFSVLLKYTL
jgi:hypothetical protein